LKVEPEEADEEVQEEIQPRVQEEVQPENSFLTLPPNIENLSEISLMQR
jgi:hypothetical protein